MWCFLPFCRAHSCGSSDLYPAHVRGMTSVIDVDDESLPPGFDVSLGLAVTMTEARGSFDAWGCPRLLHYVRRKGDVHISGDRNLTP